jgi:hypothetical protein
VKGCVVPYTCVEKSAIGQLRKYALVSGKKEKERQKNLNSKIFNHVKERAKLTTPDSSYDKENYALYTLQDCKTVRFGQC